MSELNHANSEFTGFGSHSAAEVEQLQKALGLGGQGGINIEGGGTIVDPGGSYANQLPGEFRGGNALAVEDLDRTLKLVTFGLEHLRLWKDILKERVPQVVHEYNVQNAYGLSDASPFFQMGSTPAETDAQYARDVVQIKYLGTKGAVLHNLTLIQAAHGPVVAREVKNKTIELLARNERSMFYADADIQALEYDGLDKQIISKSADSKYKSEAFLGYGEDRVLNEVVLNANGADFDEDLAEDAALTAVNNFGMPMDMYLGTDIHSAFSRAFYAKQRTVPGESLTSGNRVTEHMGTLDYRFKPSLFNRPKKNVNSKTATAAFGSINAVANYFTGGSVTAGNAVFAAVPVYADGEGDLYEITTSADTAITLVVSAESGERANILYWNIYKRDTTEVAVFGERVTVASEIAGFEFLRRVQNVVSAMGTDIMVDVDKDENLSTLSLVAGAGSAYLLMHDPDVLAWKQLGSMIKYDLAVTTTQYEWLQTSLRNASNNGSS